MNKFQTIFDKYRERYGIKEAASVPQPTPATATTSTDEQEDTQSQQTGQKTPTGSNQTNQTSSATSPSATSPSTTSPSATSTSAPTQSAAGAPQNATKPATPKNTQLQQIFANPALKDTLIATANAAKIDIGGIQPNAANVDLDIQNKLSSYINADKNGQFKQALINAITGQTNG